MPQMVLFRTTLSSDLPVSRQMDTIAAGSVLRSHGLYPSLAINRLYTLILGQSPSIDYICRQVYRQLMRNELARFYHHRARKCMPPRKLR